MWTYSGNPGNSDLDELRFLIGDVDASDPQLTDEEVTYLTSVSKDGGAGYSNYPAAVAACRALAAKYAKKIDKTTGSLSISYSQKYQHYLELAKELETAAITGTSSQPFGIPILGGGGRTYLGGRWP